MKKYILGFLLFWTFSTSVPAQTETASASTKVLSKPSEGGAVKWMTFVQAVEKSKTEKRSIFIDVYTDWCGWCKVMDKNTFNDPIVAKLLNEKFYAVKFNAEQTEDVVFNGTTFKFVPYGNKGSHQLAMALLNNQMSFPTVVFMDKDFKTAFPIAGYRKPEEFHKYLLFFSEDQSKNGQNAWAEFEKNYKSPYPQAATTTGN
jgi:thioredoxin-related protein